MTTVKDLLRIKGNAIFSVSPHTSLMDALKIMTEKNVGALLVMDDDQLAGIISERDFVHLIARDGGCQFESPVSDYMTSHVYTVAPEMTIEDCMQMMTQRRIRHLPVLASGKLAGLISIGDVVKNLISEQSSLIQDLEKYIQGSR